MLWLHKTKKHPLLQRNMNVRENTLATKRQRGAAAHTIWIGGVPRTAQQRKLISTLVPYLYAFLRKRTVTLLRMHERCNLFAVCAMARINALRLRARQDRCALRIYNRESAVQSSVNVDYSGRCLFSSPFWSGLL